MIRVGVIGCGKWGANHVRAFSGIKNCDLAGITDTSPEAKKTADRYKTSFFQDYKEMLPVVDAVSVATPTDTHYEIVKGCLESGKHVLVEKPVTLDYQQSKKLVDLAKKRGLVLAVGHLFRFNTSVIKLKEILKDAGKINYITARYIHSSKSPRLDSGVIFNFTSHLFDILNFLLEKKPEKIFCKKTNHLSDEREDYAAVLLDYGDFTAYLETSWLHPLKKRDMWIIGKKSKIYADFLNQEIEKHQIEISLEKTVNLGCKLIRTKNEPLKDELKHFIDCVENNKKPVNSGEEGLPVIKLCELALKSAKEGVEIRI